MPQPTSENPHRHGTDDLPCSFAQFLVSIGSSALVHLGELADPGTGARTVDLAVASHSIQVLEVLKRKTAGNLDPDEAQLLEALLRDLNQKYAAARG